MAIPSVALANGSLSTVSGTLTYDSQQMDQRRLQNQWPGPTQWSPRGVAGLA